MYFPYRHRILEILEEIELQNFDQACKSMEEVLEDTILQESKENPNILIGETEKKPRKRVFYNSVAFLFGVPALLYKDLLNQNLPLYREI